jgi:ferredoxin-thioredoxin reductase catalytic subunit
VSGLSDPPAARAYALQVAKHRGWVLNPDAALTDPIVAGLATQAARFGKPYCPCRDVDGGEADRDIVCPCAYAPADIAEFGQCFCGLYLAPGKDPASVGSLPERRP